MENIGVKIENISFCFTNKKVFSNFNETDSIETARKI